MRAAFGAGAAADGAALAGSGLPTAPATGDDFACADFAGDDAAGAGLDATGGGRDAPESCPAFADSVFPTAGFGVCGFGVWTFAAFTFGAVAFAVAAFVAAALSLETFAVGVFEAILTVTGFVDVAFAGCFTAATAFPAGDFAVVFSTDFGADAFEDAGFPDGAAFEDALLTGAFDAADFDAGFLAATDLAFSDFADDFAFTFAAGLVAGFTADFVADFEAELDGFDAVFAGCLPFLTADLAVLSVFLALSDDAAFAEPAFAVFSLSFSDFDLAFEAFFLSRFAI